MEMKNLAESGSDGLEAFVFVAGDAPGVIVFWWGNVEVAFFEAQELACKFHDGLAG
jgi:hypothetical protein